MIEKWLNFESVAKAKISQQEMGEKILLEDAFSTPIKNIVGLDLSCKPFDPQKRIFGAAVVVSYPSLKLVETAAMANHQTIPYIPGLLGFREVPTYIHTLKQLSLLPDLVMVDGHGIAHPRGLGVASHLGVLLDMPTIGVAKSILVGTPEAVLPEKAGSMVPLVFKGKEIGMIVRTKKCCSPLIISAGHKISLATAVDIVLNCLQGYRLPEPTRLAHLAANCCRKNHIK